MDLLLTTIPEDVRHDFVLLHCSTAGAILSKEKTCDSYKYSTNTFGLTALLPESQGEE